MPADAKNEPDLIGAELAEAARVLDAVRGSTAPASVAAAAGVIAASLRRGGKVMACGNGGSAADAMHFCEELTGRYRADRPGLAALACTDAGHITCAANDFGYDRVFARWVEALGRPGDVLVALSTSGRSRGVLLAVEAAASREMTTVTLLGRDGGVMRGLARHEILVPGETADRIQELHMLLLHAMIGSIERQMGLAG